MNKLKKIKLIFPLVLILISCTFLSEVEQEKEISIPTKFGKYWNDGKGELSSYKLEQARYGEIHSGEAVLIYVTEPFSRLKQVKLDNWQNSKDRVDILKLNFVRKFDTGIYPYSTMLSAFTSLNSGRIVKLTNTTQEWCGHVFMQFNKIGRNIQYLGRSYFEEEGDQDKTFHNVFLEDELWNLIRINPRALPQGKHEVIPSTIFLRFNHHPAQVVEADLRLQLSDSISFYTIKYENPEPRIIEIKFQTEFPHKILGWEEEYKDIAWNSERKTLKTSAILKKSIRMDYWNKNKIEHRQLRELLN